MVKTSDDNIDPPYNQETMNEPTHAAQESHLSKPPNSDSTNVTRALGDRRRLLERLRRPKEAFDRFSLADKPVHQKQLDGRDEAALRLSLLPAPLNIKQHTEPISESQHSRPPIAQIYGGAPSKIQEHFGAVDVEVGFSFLEPQTPSMIRTDTSIRLPPRTWRSSIHRISLTPSEMPYPIHMIRDYDPIDHSKAEDMLGLRRHSQAPPVPPKNPARYSRFSDSSSIGLPTYQESASGVVVEPMNGRIAKLHALTAILIVFNTWGLCNAFGLFQAYYARYYLHGTGPSAISWIGSIQLALVFGLGVPVGRLVDKGYFRVVFHGGTALLILGIFSTAACTGLWQLLLVQGIVTGFGMGMVVCAGIVALMTWWDEWKIGRAMGLAAAGSCLGGVTFVSIARHLLAANSFRTTMLVIGSVVTIGMVPPNVVFRMRGQKDRFKSKRCARSSVKAALNWHAFAEPAYLLAAAGMFFSFLGVYFGFVYMVSYGSTELHLSDTASTNLLILMLLANLPGRFVPALISDHCIGPLNTLVPSVLLSSVIIWLWAVSGDRKESLIVIACFYGFTSAGIQVLYAPAVYTFCLEPSKFNASTTESKLAVDRIGLKAGVVFSAIGVGCLIGLPTGGALISYRTDRGLSQPYLGAQIFAGVCLLLGGFLLLSSRVVKAGWSATRA